MEQRTLECFGAFTVVVIGIICFAAVVSFANARSRGWNLAYRALARKYGGSTFSGGVFGSPSAKFQYGETFCSLNNIKTHARYGGQFTQLTVQWSDPAFRLEIFPEWRKSRLWPFSGMQEFAVDDSKFSSRYVSRTNDPKTAGLFLSPGVRWQIDRLRSFLKRDDIYLSINRGVMSIKKPSYVKDQTLLDDFVRYGLELYDQAMLTKSIGISFVEEDQTQVLDSILCQICGDTIQLDMVFCVRCKTPHCLECWEYYGQCSTFACGETRYVTPGIVSGIVDNPDA